MSVNLSWLDDFHALAESGNFSRAAQQRNMTQPAFSRRIRALEAWLGTPLFDRSDHPVALTEAGQWFRSTSRQVLERVARLPEEAQAVAEGSAGTLRFAATHALSLSFLPAWLRRLESRVAIGPIQLVSDVAAQCETLLQQGRVQFLMCHTHAEVPSRLDASDVDVIDIGEDRLLPVVAPDPKGRPMHTLGNHAAAAKASQPVPLLAYSAESGLGRLVRSLRGAALDKAGCDAVFTAHLATVLRKLALEGRGLAFLPASLVIEDLEARRLVAAGPASWTIPVRISLFRRRATMSALAERFWSAAHSG